MLWRPMANQNKALYVQFVIILFLLTWSDFESYTGINITFKLQTQTSKPMLSGYKLQKQSLLKLKIYNLKLTLLM